MKINRQLLVIGLVSMLFIPMSPLLAVGQNADQEQDSATVLQAFTGNEAKKSDVVAIDDQTKRIVMFAMGVPLLILLIITVALGIAMGVYGKQVFVPHMICAGLSLTLAVAHAIVGIVWFYPF